MRIALYEPEIPGNVGSTLRLGACLGVPVDLIEPMGFSWDDKRVRRSAMDYIDHVSMARHANFSAFQHSIGTSRLILFTTKSTHSAYDFQFQPDDILLFGKESAGIPREIADQCHACVRLPMKPEVRSINLAMAVSLAIGEGLRQTNGLPTIV